jgi:hypothetical protein
VPSDRRNLIPLVTLAAVGRASAHMVRADAKQEAEAGFDAATRLHGGRLLLLQFKAGRKLKNGSVRFTAPHGQLGALQSP